MGFHFAFEALYRLRQSVEHQQELRLRAANQQVAKVRHAIEQLTEQAAQLQVESSEHLASGTIAAEIRFMLHSINMLVLHQREAEQMLARASSMRDQQENVFRQARRERETLEILREQQLQRYQRTQLRRQQQRLDDLFLLRRSYWKRT
ncbi:MAG TPA: flagellar FliJ family protein [Candidatus Eisenbacteria bacterium]|nr:flagellar FliJ family protein [Candidatus Eisenbacteria bacterium]